MDSPKISLVMPSLNVQPYIEECLKSVIGQTMQDWEAFIVDAGSTDGTLEILHEYAAKDHRLHILSDDRGSTGYANNKAIKAARGEYIGIVETDDYISPDMYEKLYAAAKTVNADICRMDYVRFWGNGEGREFLHKHVASKGEYGRVIAPRKEQGVFRNDPFTWTGIYRRQFLRDKEVWHHETKGAAYQDTGFWFQSFSLADSLLYIKGEGYHYRLDNPGSSVHDKGKAFALADELTFVREQMERRGIFQAFSSTFYEILFNRYLWSYQRADTSLRLDFAKRFREDMLPAVNLNLALTAHQRTLLDELQASPEKFYASRESERLALEGLLNGDKPLVMLGCGSDGMRMLDYLQQRDALKRLVCLADNDCSLQGQERGGKTILSLKVASMRYPGAVWIVTSLNYSDVLTEQLKSMGVTENLIWTGHVC